MLKLLTRTRKE